MKPFVLSGVANTTSGFGIWFVQLVEYFDKLDLPFRVIPVGPPPFSCSEAPLPACVQKRIDRPGGGEEWTIQVAPPAYGIRASTPKVAWVVAWETTMLPAEHVIRLNGADLVIASSNFNKTVFEDCGVKVLIEVCPPGLEDFWFAPRVQTSRPTTYIGGGEANQVCPERKGFDDLLEAFLWAFPSDSDVQLLIHQTPMSVWRPKRKDPRIIVKRRFLKQPELLRWFHQGDVFVTAARAEGWGMMPLQAAATGIPTVGCHFGGSLDYLDHANSYSVLFDLQPVTNALPEYAGRWAVPRIDSLALQMRAAREDSGRVHRGQAAKAVAMQFAMDKVGEKLSSILAKYGVT